jgi:hypothetical protein
MVSYCIFNQYKNLCLKHVQVKTIFLRKKKYAWTTSHNYTPRCLLIFFRKTKHLNNMCLIIFGLSKVLFP